MKSLRNKIILAAFLILVPTAVLAVDTAVSVPVKSEKPAAWAAAPVSPKSSKIGAIDVSYIGRESEYGKSVTTLLTDKKDKLEKKLLAEKKKLDALKDSITSKLATYTPKQREAKSKEFQGKVELFQKLVHDSQESLMKEQEGETEKIFAQIEKTVADYGKANDFGIIVSKKDILYVGSETETQDLTSIILKAVNDTWKKK